MRSGTDWFDLWCKDKDSLLNTMVRNMASDLDAGYNYFGNCIQKQMADINAFRQKYDDQMMAFADMDDQKVNRWCYYDLKRRGAIS